MQSVSGAATKANGWAGSTARAYGTNANTDGGKQTRHAAFTLYATPTEGSPACATSVSMFLLSLVLQNAHTPSAPPLTVT